MKLQVVLLLVSLAFGGFGQEYAHFQSRLGELKNAAAAPGSSLEEVWSDLKSKNEIPLIEKDSVCFLYRGQATSVEWIGDFNQWGYDKTFPSRGHRLGSSNVWMLKASFPTDARLDYKIIVDGTRWILDPENPNQQWSGVGGGSVNSELRMPLFREDPILKTRPAVARGTVTSDILLNSAVLNYQITYSIYVPAAHAGERLPVVYVTDGYEYTHPQMGNMITVLDNLIADKKIKPIIAVFIDHREPVNRSNNRRMEELAMNARYLQFFTDEFIPHIEKNYSVEPGSRHRAILGNSMGGLNAAYFVFAKPEVFSMAGIQSPAFYTRPQIFSLCEKSDGTPIKISMTAGLINDTSDGGRKMKTILETTACTYQYREVNQGHSWGNWRNLIDDILVDFFAP